MTEDGRSSVYDRRTPAELDAARRIQYRPPRPPMSAGRVVWMVFCLGWAGFWLLFGWFLPGLNLALAVASGLMILVPIGKPRM